jgi:hypothetical protein
MVSGGRVRVSQTWRDIELHAPGKPVRAVWRERLPVSARGQGRTAVAACGVRLIGWRASTMTGGAAVRLLQRWSDP